jgi:hypothetical protein
MTLQQDIEALKSYWNPKNDSTSLEVVRAAIDYKRLQGSTEGQGNSTIFALTPSLNRVIGETSGTILSGAKFVSIFVESGTGTVLGTTVSEGMEIALPYYGGTWGAIAYTVDASSSFLIQEGR